MALCVISISLSQVLPGCMKCVIAEKSGPRVDIVSSHIEEETILSPLTPPTDFRICCFCTAPIPHHSVLPQSELKSATTLRKWACSQTRAENSYRAQSRSVSSWFLATRNKCLEFTRMILKMRKRFLSHLRSHPNYTRLLLFHFHCSDRILSSFFSQTTHPNCSFLPSTPLPLSPRNASPPRFSQKGEGVPWDNGAHSSHHSSQACEPASSLPLKALAYKSGHGEKLLSFVNESGRPGSALALLAPGCREGFE